MMKTRLMFLKLLLLSLSLLSCQVCAASKDIEMNIQGTLMVPADCQITGTSYIVVNFGDNILNSNLDGEHYITDFSVPVVCTGSPVGVKMKMSAETLDAYTLQTSKANLGVRIIYKGALLPLNSWFDIDYSKPVEFKATPVRQNAGTIAGGRFSGFVTVLLLLP
ncbi:fimbrial protein [Enterobacteriaceae bacterium RIT714]|nr:fimbrial protein [Enterobacteriaceae bacterium RIT714]